MDNFLEIISIFLVIGLSFSLIFLLKNVAVSRTTKPRAIIPLSLIAILCVELFYGWLYGTKYILLVPHLLRLNTPLVYLIGPLVYLMMKVLSQPNMKWHKNNMWHCIPFFLCLIYLIPLYNTSAETKALYLDKMYNQLGFDSYLFGITRRVHQGIYLVWSMVFVSKQKDSLEHQGELKSSIFLISIVFLLWSISLIRFFFSFDLLSAMVDALVLSAIAVFLVYKQLRIHPFKVRKESKELAELFTQIEYKMRSQKLFLDPKLTLHQLARQLNTNSAKVSGAINRITNQNFNDFINRYRVEEAKTLLGKAHTKHLTIEAIGMQAGFNSSSTFNSQFKRITGKSPKSFRK